MAQAPPAMEQHLCDLLCPGCKKPLEGVQISGEWGRCPHCARSLHMHAGFREAVVIATANEGWIEKIWWKRSTNELIVYCIEMPWIASVWLLPFSLLLGCLDWRFFLGLAPFVSLWLLRRILEQFYPTLFPYAAQFIVCSRGIVLVRGIREPLFLPWSSIVNYSWTSHVGSMTSHMTLGYATVDGQVATVILGGEEKTQPLGELVDILEARLGSRPR